MSNRKIAAKIFASDWSGRGNKRQDTQVFWMSLLQQVYGIADPAKFIQFAVPVKIEHTSYIDGYIPSTSVLIEQKGRDVDLRRPYKQSDGSMLTPFQQARRYAGNLPYAMYPRWIVVCNFRSFEIHDMDRPDEDPETLLLSDLEHEYYRLEFLVDLGNEHIRKEMHLSLEAVEIVGDLYDALLQQYADPTDPSVIHSLNVLCVRLLFCLYAENSGVFGKYGMFHDYLETVDARRMRKALQGLFDVLDTPEGQREKYLAQDDPLLAAFPYVNGGLFDREEAIEIPPFTEEIRSLLLDRASAGFDWSEISPTIFGAVCESILDPETKRTGGMHYTSVENIHKVIDPLFLDDLKEEYEKICQEDVLKTRNKALRTFQDKLASLSFLDPACGSGDLLMETYLSLRRLENKVIEKLAAGQMQLGVSDDLIKVSISQFHGIEMNDLAVTMAKTALWIAESQMMKETEEIVMMDLDLLPLTTNAFIVEGNALRMDWEEVVPKRQLDYIMGAPPFVGARMMSTAQKQDVKDVFAGWKHAGDLDYVCCWYKKASEMMQGTNIRAALVSTSSVCQGECVSHLWRPLMDSGVHIDFAHRTFQWDSEASIKAQVHCVIIGFSVGPYGKDKVIYTDGRAQKAKNINGYLVDADDIFV